MSDLGIVVPQVRKAEVGYYSFWQWQQEYEQAHPTPPIENIRFEHDPDWRMRGFSIQAAHDGSTPFWAATHVVVRIVVPIAMGMTAMAGMF